MSFILNQKLKIIKLSEEGMQMLSRSKARPLVSNSQAVNAKEKLLKEIKSATLLIATNDKKVIQPYFWYGESFVQLDRRSDQSHISLSQA